MKPLMFRDTTAQDRALEVPPFWRRHLLALVVAVAVAIVAGALLPQITTLARAQATVSLSRVTIATVERGRFVRDFSADGRIVAASSPMLYSSAAGTVVLRVHAGDAVKRNQVLAVIDSPDLMARLSQERATLQSAKTDLERARLEAERLDSDAREAFAQAQVDHTTAKREYERSRKAYEFGAYSELQMMRAQDELEKATFALERARRTLATRPRQSRFDIQSRESLLAREQLLVEDLERQVAALELRSPVDGQVGQIPVADRASVARDAPLLTVVDLSQLEVEIQVPESLARDLSSGMAAELTGNGKQWSGTVSAVSPEVVDGQVIARVRLGDVPTTSSWRSRA
jgi:HlyD family secretion protein